MKVRQPIVTVLGHVDSGKTSLLDRIRGTGVQGREAGGITQHIGASFLPLETIREQCGGLYSRLESSKVRVPGILVIDTPGHEVFKNLRTRGGSAADIAILVVDAARGLQPQTTESLRILASRKVPFVVALNKCDQISGWRASGGPIGDIIKAQAPSVQADLDQKIYDVVGSLSVLGYGSEAFYRVRDFTKEVSIVPVSARTGAGIPELLTILVGLTQQFLASRLDQESKESRGIVLEVKEEPGLGQTANVILVDGSLSKSDTMIAARRDSVVSARPRAILLPKPLDEMRDPRDRFVPVESVEAASGIKIASPDLDGVLPGSTLYISHEPGSEARFSRMLEEEMRSVFVNTESSGVVARCDTIGSLEALAAMLSESGVPVSKADVGPVTRRDIMEARAVKEGARRLGVVLAFNVRVLPDAREEAEACHVRIFEGRVIYRLIDEYREWAAEDEANEEDAIFSEITPVARFQFLEGCVFRNSDPAVFGIRVDAGLVRQKTQFMNSEGRRIGTVHQLQIDGKPVGEVGAGKEAACSVQGPVVGRQVSEGDVFYTMPSSREARSLSGRFGHRLDAAQSEALAKITELLRARDPAYGY